MDFNTPVSQLSRVGKTTAKRLGYLGVKTAGDLLRHFPFRYEDYSRVAPIAGLRDGDVLTVRGRIELIANKRSPRQRRIFTEALIADNSGSIRVVWFNQPFIVKLLKAGDEVFLSGKVRTDMFGPQMVSPVYERADKGGTTHTARLVPIYPTTAGVTQKQIRFLVSQIIDLARRAPEWIPADILRHFNLRSLSSALRGIHFPAQAAELNKSTERLKFDELFLLQIKGELSRKQRSAVVAPALEFKKREVREFVGRLPFLLTKAQKVSAWEILQDIAKNTPMNRLLSGDVGSGKTVVAAMAIYNAILNGYQAALMAPTEILALQHFNSLCRLLGEKAAVGLLTNSRFSIFNWQFLHHSKNAQKREFLDQVAAGKVDIVIGTHALLIKDVHFKNLGLVIVDEQHRFGVEQRRMIKEKGGSLPPSPPLGQGGTHFLSMTATPIPRSLALLLYGDLDVSIINELPPGRKKIITRLVEPLNRRKAYDFIRGQIKKGRQAFVICPLIEEKDENENGKSNIKNLLSDNNIQYPIRQPADNIPSASDKKTVLREYQKLSQDIFPDLRIGYLHGRMRPKEKEETMRGFREGRLDILVSTSVVEVGIDIPNASVMMIEGAERFGLAQLHQFRGRVGRAEHQSYCLLFTDTDSRRALERLKFFETHHDGFKLAEKDLEMRGPGEVYGTEQSGMMNLRLAKLTDAGIIKKAREAARMVIGDLKKYSSLLDKVKAWEKQVHLE